MNYCSCGELVEDAGDRCARCAALKIFKLQSSATKQEIEDAYHALAKMWQPDPFQHDEKLKKAAEERMRAIHSAYAVLKLLTAKDNTGPEVQLPASTETGSDPEPEPQPEPPRSYANRWERFTESLPRPTTMLAIGALVAGLCVAGFLAKEIDSYITGEPFVGEQYSKLKFFIGAKLHEATGNNWNHPGVGLPSAIPEKSPTVADATPTANAAENSARVDDTPHIQLKHKSNTAQAEQHGSNAGELEHVKALPYITAGLSKAEVIAIQGAPTLSSEDKLTYGRTEFYFSNDKLAGWKIDPTSASARVKLWPESAVDPNLQSFTVGSTKDQVLVVQGTPTLFTDDKFGYGGSEVFFQNDRVIGWKADPGSVSLRATSQ